MSDEPQLEVPIVHKPSWLDRAIFSALIDRYDVPHCERCGTIDDLTVDHIIARHAGGTDDLSNLQFLCRVCNSTKGIRPDNYWSQTFYWDKLPDDAGFANLRHPQREFFNEIVHYRSDWFGRRNISEIARHLYINPWVVGAGKTLAIAVAGWAVNYTIQAHWGKAARRADRMLVIAKDQAIRDQIAESLATDLSALGIVKKNPRVGVVEQGWQFGERAWLDSHDAIVVCEQHLWEAKGHARKDLAEILAHFPVIAFDEPHYAPEQIVRIVDAASSSLCFGFTGTPVDKCAELLPRMVALTIYDYQEACEIDRSLKYLDADQRNFRGMFVNELGIHDADILENGNFTITEDTQKDGYSKNIEPAKAVVKEVIAEMMARDEIKVEYEQPALHRREPDVEASMLYPVHAIVYFDNIATAESLATHLNKWFDDNRDQYPEHKGWRIEVVHAGSKGGPAKPLARKTGAPPHPWMRYKHKGQMDRQCARILFVVDMAREGVNNPYCGVVGVACKSTSVLDSVQGWLGRQLRAVYAQEGLTFRVPPAPLDTVRVVTHSAFGVAGAIREGIDFICNMRSKLAELPTIEGLEKEEPKPLEVIERGLDLPAFEKVKIACYLGARDVEGVPVDLAELLERFAPAGGRKAERVQQWVETVRQDPERALAEARLAADLRPIPIVVRERIKRDPSDRDLERFVKIHQQQLVRRLPVTNSDRELFVALYDMHARQFHSSPLALTETDGKGNLIRINKLVRSLVGSAVLETLGGHFIGDKSLVWKFSTGAAARKLGVPGDKQLKDKSDWDTPQAHAIIKRADVRSELVGYVIRRLAEQGYVPNLALLFRQEKADVA